MTECKKNGGYTKTYLKYMGKYYEQYLKINYTMLQQIYSNCSMEKFVVYQHIIREYPNAKILSFNNNYFTVGYIFKRDNKYYFGVRTGKSIHEMLLICVSSWHILYGDRKTQDIYDFIPLEDDEF